MDNLNKELETMNLDDDKEFYIEFLQNELDEVCDLVGSATPTDLKLYWEDNEEERQAIIDLYNDIISPLPDKSCSKQTILLLLNRLGINPYKKIKTNHILKASGFK